MAVLLNECDLRAGFSAQVERLPGVTICLRHPASVLARQAVALERAMANMQTQLDAARTGAHRRPERATSRLHVAAALAENLSFCRGIRSVLLPVLSASEVLTAAANGSKNGLGYPVERLFALLRRDWSGMPECEAEIKTFLAALRGHLPRQLARDANILVLGSGVGRLADELASQHDRVFSLDLSAPLLISAAHLRTTPIAAHEISTRHARSGADQAKAFEAAWRLKGQSKSHLMLADATDLPFADGWADLVLSVYFTDVVPPRKLLPEVRRVLRPGGRFIHFGPLGYHFDDADDHLSADELLQEVESFGFVVGEPGWVTSTHECDQRSIYECRFHNLLFSADATIEPRFVSWTAPRTPFV